jgi:hypothetical protein
MYFLNKDRSICHILEDQDEGKAPAPCGSKANRLDLMRLSDGKTSDFIVAKKPPEIPLCKHCQKAREWL